MGSERLFRQEVMHARRGQWLGSIHLAAPLAISWLATFTALLTVAIALFMAFGHYTRRERVSGQLLPSAGVLGVRSAAVGTVARVYVHEGQHVRRGAALVEVSGELDSAALGSTRALVSAQLHAQRTRLQVDLQDQQRLAAEQDAGLKAKLSMLRRQASQIDGQIVLELRQAASAQQMLNRIKPLQAKGYVSAFQVEQEEATALQMQSQTKALVRQKLDTQQQIQDAQQQLAQLPLDLAAKQSDIQRALADNDQQLAQNELQRASVLRAPADGVVSTLLVKPGQAVMAQQPMLSILPGGSTLQAQLLVPSRAVGFIEPGNRVVLRYQAFPYQKFGQQYGRVLDVSRSALSNAEVASLLGANSSEPLYRVLVGLDSQTVNAYGKDESLKPGMALDADILLDRRSLWQWAFEPLYGLRQQLATEYARRG